MLRIKKRKRRGFTLLETMVAMALSTIVLTGALSWLAVVRTSWLDASEVVEQVEACRAINASFVRGGLGYGSGLQSAVPPILLDNDETRGLSIIYRNYANEYYAIHINPEGEVFLIRQTDSNPWWIGGYTTFSRIEDTLTMKVHSARYHQNKLEMDYTLEFGSASLKRSKPGRFVWNFGLDK